MFRSLNSEGCIAPFVAISVKLRRRNMTRTCDGYTKTGLQNFHLSGDQSSFLLAEMLLENNQFIYTGPFENMCNVIHCPFAAIVTRISIPVTICNSRATILLHTYTLALQAA